MARRLNLRKMREAKKNLDGVSLEIGRTLKLASGAELQPGDAVPAEVLSDPNIGRLIKYGYVKTSELVDHRAIRPAPAPAEPEAEKKADASTLTKAELRAALEERGVEIPSGATKAELVSLYGE